MNPLMNMESANSLQRDHRSYAAKHLMASQAKPGKSSMPETGERARFTPETGSVSSTRTLFAQLRAFIVVRRAVNAFPSDI